MLLLFDAATIIIFIVIAIAVIVSITRIKMWGWGWEESQYGRTTEKRWVKKGPQYTLFHPPPPSIPLSMTTTEKKTNHCHDCHCLTNHLMKRKSQRHHQRKCFQTRPPPTSPPQTAMIPTLPLPCTCGRSVFGFGPGPP